MIIRQQAFSEECNVTMYKGGLHCHTTRSDGHGTPKEVIRLYKKNGYDTLPYMEMKKEVQGRKI